LEAVGINILLLIFLLTCLWRIHLWNRCAWFIYVYIYYYYFKI
jgi:hypothetical protein